MRSRLNRECMSSMKDTPYWIFRLNASDLDAIWRVPAKLLRLQQPESLVSDDKPSLVENVNQGVESISLQDVEPCRGQNVEPGRCLSNLQRHRANIIDAYRTSLRADFDNPPTIARKKRARPCVSKVGCVDPVSSERASHHERNRKRHRSIAFRGDDHFVKQLLMG